MKNKESTILCTYMTVTKRASLIGCFNNASYDSVSWPYGSEYDQTELRIRKALYDLGVLFNIPLCMLNEFNTTPSNCSIRNYSCALYSK